MDKSYRWASDIVSKLKESGFKAYFAGGCVRDMVMKRVPVDYDVATDASLETIKGLFSKTVEVGAGFGVVLVINKGEKCQVSTFRATSGDPRDDAALRDFTINGLFYDPQEDRIFDWVGAIEDIKSRIVRAIGSPRDRFNDDYLRMIRAIRIASDLGFQIEEKTFGAIKQMAHLIRYSSRERIRDELIKILSANPARGFDLLCESGLLYAVIPELNPASADNTAKLGRIKVMLSNMDKPDYLISLASIFCEIWDYSYLKTHDCAFCEPVQLVDSLKKYKLSNCEIKTIRNILNNHIKFIHAPELSSGRVKKLMQSESFDLELEFHKLRLLSLDWPLGSYNCLKNLREKFDRTDIHPAPLLNGDDLIRIGYYPGRLVGQILSELEFAQLEGRIVSKQDAVNWAISRFKK